jgi:protein SCO1/2
MKRFRMVGLLVLVVLVGCKSDATRRTDNEYDVRGKVVGLNPDKPAVTLDHEDIPGLMKAMQMEFAVADARLLEGVKVGDHVQGRLKKADSGYVITRLEKRTVP